MTGPRVDRPALAASAADAAALAVLFGEPVRVIDRRPSSDRSTHALERAVIELSGGSRLDLVLKGSRVAQGGFVRPAAVRDEEREAWAYGSLLDPDRLDTARFHGVVDRGTPRERLVLEAISGRPLAERGEREAWLEAARWLARFHAWGRRSSAPRGARERLLAQSETLHRGWWRRAVDRCDTAGRPGESERLSALATAYERAVVRLAATPVGLVHGEFYPSNILVERTGGAWRVRPVDWESVGIGPTLLDVAALTTGGWTARERGTFLDAYAASRGDIRPADLAAARMVNAAQWLGWSSAWRPPVEHARDWLAELEDAADGTN